MSPITLTNASSGTLQQPASPPVSAPLKLHVECCFDWPVSGEDQAYAAVSLTGRSGRQANILVRSARVIETRRLSSIKSQPGMSANHLQQKAPANEAIDQDASVRDAAWDLIS